MRVFISSVVLMLGPKCGGQPRSIISQGPSELLTSHLGRVLSRVTSREGRVESESSHESLRSVLESSHESQGVHILTKIVGLES